MIIVTGASGRLGSLIVDRLIERIPADQVGVSVRDPQAVEHLASAGVRVRHGDYEDPESLLHAFEGAEQVLVVSGSTHGEAAVNQHIAAIDAARSVGGKRIVYTSHMASSTDSLFAPMPDHAATERYLADVGIAYTSLRNGFYASTVPFLIGPRNRHWRVGRSR